jgi:Uma2 family endonuclease
MAATARLTFEEFLSFPGEEGKSYELDQGELLMTPFPTVSQNRIRDRIFLGLKEFVEAHPLGEVMLGMDFRLGLDTVRRPDVALVTCDHLQKIDVEHWPVNGAPALAMEVISPSNSAQDTAKKIDQYLRSGCRSVWVVYPNLRSVEVHAASGVRKVQDPKVLNDDAVLPGFSMPLSHIFEGKK